MNKLRTIAAIAITALAFVSCASLPEYTAVHYELVNQDGYGKSELIAFEGLDIRPNHYKADSKKAAKGIRKYLKKTNKLNGVGNTSETGVIVGLSVQAVASLLFPPCLPLTVPALISELTPDSTNLALYRNKLNMSLLPNLLNEHQVVALVGYTASEHSAHRQAYIYLYSDKSPDNDKVYQWFLRKKMLPGEELKWDIYTQEE